MSPSSHTGFETEQSEVEFLRQRLAEEQAAAERANERRLDAEARLAVLERERDVYRMLARRWQTRYDSMMVQQDRGGELLDDDEDDDDGDDEGLVDRPARLGLGQVLARLRNRRVEESESSSSSEEEEEPHDQQQFADPMEEDDDESHDDDSLSEAMEDSTSHGSSALIAAEPIESDAGIDSQAIEKAASLAYRQQSRTVSISEGDL